MEFRKSLVLFTGLALLGALPARADFNADALAGLQAALAARDKAITDVYSPDARHVAQWALDTVVFEGLRALRNNGDHRLANRYEDEWNHQFTDALTRDAILGDHKPLLQWLANFYDKLEDRLGTTTIRNGLLGDIYLMNFAIPIVFTPKGDWRTPTSPNRDWVEYRKHFIPFSNVITYWGVKIACNKIMKNRGAGKDGQKLCEKAATKLRFVMGRYIAPKISDFVFKKANGETADLNITPVDLVYSNAQGLFDDLKKEGGAL